ncbi:ubiquitin hydrolase [Stachybotrys elegans]|uniref:ubiquitinyl hydrolase 1 n=1 Tax=Stachybotrys elegans TaxID=80388 RepID=A0A8K0SRP6_9HYPO|nr:ubiquitin hydrolase [Stachybotrys elegans]
MTSQHTEFKNFYDARSSGHRQLHSRDILWERASEPGVAVTIALVLLSIFYSVYGPRIAPDGLFVFLGDLIWDTLVYLVPTSLLELLDKRDSSAPQSSMTTTHTTIHDHASKSDAMRRVLGLDRSGGVMASVLQVRSRALSTTGSALGFKLDTQRPPGLGNRDNSCYQNSILQGLASLSTFPDYLSTCLRSMKSQESKGDVAQTLRTLITDLNDQSNNGKTLWTPSVLKSMSTWTQQDAQEYYSKILDDIDKAIAAAVKTTSRHTGLRKTPDGDGRPVNTLDEDPSSQPLTTTAQELKNPLEGLLAQRVACVTCGYSEGLSMIPFNCLTLSLGLNQQSYDLKDRLNAYTKLEPIEGVECPRCTLLKANRLLTRLVNTMKEKDATEQQLKEPTSRLEAVELALEEDALDDKTIHEKCKVSNQTKVTTTKTKQIVIARPPQSLVIHMNRSVFDPATFNMMKNSAPVRFPMVLDLGPWCLGSADPPGTDPTQEKISETERWQLGPEISMVAGDASESRISGPLYELKAAVTHYGRHENGHYICYRKLPRNGQPPSPVRGGKASSPIGAEGSEDSKDGEEAYELDSMTEDEEEMDWWRLSDHNVTKVDEETVLGLSPGVFMLFYDCIDPRVVYNAVASAEPAPKTNGITNGHAQPTTAVSQAAAGSADSGQGEAAQEPETLKPEDGSKPTVSVVDAEPPN